jgi:hypothetical protein
MVTRNHPTLVSSSILNPNMHMKMHVLLFLLLSGLFTSCSPTYTYYTKDLIEQEQWSQEDIMRIQFYLSKDIILSRSVQAGETSITEGKIKVKNGERVEQVIIRSGTPGVLVLMPREDRFAISFEEEDNEAYLMFGPNPKYGDRFALLAQEWESDYGQVHYKDKVYSVDASSAFASLMVDLRKEGQSQYETKNIKGRTVKN